MSAMDCEAHNFGSFNILEAKSVEPSCGSRFHQSIPADESARESANLRPV